MSELHPLTELILKRMESHPEEFEQKLEGKESHRIYTANIGRWDIALDIIKNNGSDADLEAVATAVSKIRMDEAHRWAMDELLNGPARREAERREHEEQVKLHRQMAQQAVGSQPMGTYTTYATPLQTSMDEIKQSKLKSLLGKAFK